MIRFIYSLILSSFAFVPMAQAGGKVISSVGGSCCTASKSCCSSGCPDIVPCPNAEVIQRKVCDVNIPVYEVEGYLNYWTELMHAPRQTCEYDTERFDAMVFNEATQYNAASQEFTHLKKVVLYPWWVQTIEGTKNIAHQPRWQNRRFKARGCYVDANNFMVEWIDFERHTIPHVGE